MLNKFKPLWFILLILLGVVVFTRVMATEGAILENQPSQGIPSSPTITPPAQDTDLVLPPFPATPLPLIEGIRRFAQLKTSIPTRPRVDVTTYVVQPGDNLFVIAEKFGLKPETVLWGNFEVLQDNPQFLRPDQVLNILPVDGTYYQWAEGDQLETVAEFFRVSPDDILEYPGNRFDLAEVSIENQQLAAGTWLIIPNGRRELRDWGPPAITRNNPASAAYYGSGSCGQIYQGAIGTNTFLWPTVSRSISGYDYNPNIHPGLDIAGPEGNSVFATDSGVVVYAGWSEYGYGYLIVLDHGTGWQSAYAHLSAVGVGCGQSVAQGTVIGAVGNTGNSTGAHLHFELRSELYGKVNPWDYLTP
ncbi:MAG TPA: peptidoglycan DD-metalloendopeptidase family protein [Anaerolineales bacterium]|nr:peptidoglycan DD-metalloendopeptidase family protein [Anaerolineales bacterium]